MPDIASPGHKLGQMIGNFFENLFSEDLISFCAKLGFFCDRKGPRPQVRGNSRKVTWVDNRGNAHDLDYVVERGGSVDQRGAPVAFIEVAWRRYTKQSRNKAGELEGSLLPLRETYPSCRFLGAILAGEFTDGGKNQLASHGIAVLHIPFEVLVRCFKTKGVELEYPERASPDQKMLAIRRWQALSGRDISDIERSLRRAIDAEYAAFKQKLQGALLRKVESVRLLPLYGSELVFASVRDAASALSKLADSQPPDASFIKLEIQLRFTDGDKIDASFHSKDEALHFLATFS